MARLPNANLAANAPPPPPKEFSSEDLDYLATLVAEKISGEVGDKLARQGDFVNRIATRVAELQKKPPRVSKEGI